MQVLSKSVADALEYYTVSQTPLKHKDSSDRFFDMLNTRHLEEGIRKRKPDLAPYRTPDDSRLKVYRYIEVQFNIIVRSFYCL